MTWQIDDDDLAGAGLDGLLRQYEAGLAHLDTIAPDDLEARVEHLQALAVKLALGERMLRVYDAMKFVPPDRQSRLNAWGCVVHGQEVKGAERARIVRIELQSLPYTLTFREPDVNYVEVTAMLDLHAGQDRLVFSVLLHLDVNEPGDGWTPGRIEAFVPGDWVHPFLELSTRLDHPTQTTDVSPAESLRKKFGL